MTARLKIIFFFLLSVSTCINAFDGKDSLLESGVLSFKAGYYPYQSWTLLENEGFVLGISHNDFNNFLNWGYAFSLYKGFKNKGENNALIMAGISIAHKTEFFNKIILLRLVAGLSTPTFPAFTNILEVDYIFDFYGAAVNFSLAAGVVMFRSLIPISISIGFSF